MTREDELKKIEEHVRAGKAKRLDYDPTAEIFSGMLNARGRRQTQGRREIRKTK